MTKLHQLGAELQTVHIQQNIKLPRLVAVFFTVGGVMIRNAELSAGKNEIRLDRSGIYFLRLTNAHASAVSRVIVR